MNTAARPSQSSSPSEEKRSQLVTIFAWINIILGGLSVFGCLVLMLLFKTLVPTDEILAALNRPDVAQVLSPAAVYMLRHIQTLLFLSLALSVLMLFASHALLKRRNWARLFWVWVMALIAVWCVVGLFFPPDVAKFLPPQINNAPELQAQMKAMIASVKVYGAVLSLVQAGVFAWAVWRFCSEDIRREFQAD